MNRYLAIRSIRAKLKSKELSLGSWMQLPNGSVAEIMGQSGYDWVALDLEHGSFSLHQLPDLFRALELGGTLPLVRLAEGSERELKGVLDAGAGGVIIPKIETSAQLERACSFCKWPPSGLRGVGFSRANLFGRRFESYSEEAQCPFIVAMIESRLGVENLNDILSVKGLDAVLIGPYDLSASFGLTGQFENAEFQEIMAMIKNKALEEGISVGLHIVQPSIDQLDQCVQDGFTFVPYSIDSVMLEKAAAMLQWRNHNPLTV